MPPVAGAVAAAALGGITVGGTLATGLTLGFSLGNALVAGVSSFALGALSSALSSKPKPPNLGSYSVKASNRNLQIRQPITAHRLVYGESRTSGPLIFAASTNGDKYLHMVIVLAACEVGAIDEVWANDEVIPNDFVDANGNVIAGRFSGRMRIKKHLGGASQTADVDLVAEVAEWTSAHRGGGCAYLYIRLESDRNVYPSGAPNFSAVVRGKEVIDPRSGQLVWSPNVALQSYDYLGDEQHGIDVDDVDIDSATVSAAANACDEIVDTLSLDADLVEVDIVSDILTLDGDVLILQRGDRVQVVTTGGVPGGLSVSTDYYVIPYQFGVNPRIRLAASLDDAINSVAIDLTTEGSGTHIIRKTGEPRYFGGGVIETDSPLGNNLRDVMSGMGGTAVSIGGLWSLFAAVYRAPSVVLNETHMRAPLTINTRLPRKERFNGVKGVYVAPFNDWQPADYPIVTDSTHVAEDANNKIYRDLDLPFTQRPHTAQRLAKIALEQGRREISLDYPCKFSAIQFQPTDTLYVDNERMQFSSKVFEVHSHAIVDSSQGDGVPALGVDMFLRETDAAVYNWSASEEGGIVPAARTNYPDIFTVSVVGGFSLDSIPVFTQAADKVFNVLASWDAPTDQFILSGGKFEVEYKESTESVYKSDGKVDGTVTQVRLPSLQPDVLYDVRIYAFNNLGVRSQPTYINNFLVGTTVTTDTQDWENETLSSEDWENDTLSSEDWEA